MLGCEKYLNYAYSGARSGRSNFYFENWSGIEWQIEQFTNRKMLKAAKDTIVVLQTGGLIDLFAGETNASTIIKNLQKSLQMLLETDCLSFSTIVLMNLPDLSSAPGLNSAPGLKFAEDGQLIKDTFAVSIAQINTQIRTLSSEVARAASKVKPVNLRLFDLNSAMFKAINPLNTTEPFSYQKPDTLSKDVSSYAYHDLWHPTTIVHYDIAKELAIFLEDT
uniref:Uncharacterized protein n=1 Tax=Panagrolaimus sp. JU765 TaxID=591449 RepID=A0AC34QW24_9BILA